MKESNVPLIVVVTAIFGFDPDSRDTERPGSSKISLLCSSVSLIAHGDFSHQKCLSTRYIKLTL